MTQSKLILKGMGVMNITPNSFSDGGEVQSSRDFLRKFQNMGPMDILDIGAESTAPMNEPISWENEWERWQMILPELKNINLPISADTYHPETIFELTKYWKDHQMKVDLIWNDVSGKFDDAVEEFLAHGENYHYVLCHNRAPKRELAGRHMDYVQESSDILQELIESFEPHTRSRVIFDPCLGFSKTYAENWQVLQNYPFLMEKLPQSKWLLGFSRKSFLRQKFSLEKTDKEKLDQIHSEVLNELLPKLKGELWVRTHRPDLLSLLK